MARKDAKQGLYSYKGSEIFRDPEFPLGALDAMHPASFFAHTHEFIEIVLVVSGQGIHRFGPELSAKPFPCGIMKGDMLILRPGEVHSFVCCSNLRLFNVMFMPEMIAAEKTELGALPGLKGLFEGRGKLRLPLSLRERAAALAKRIKDEASSRKAGWRLSAKACLIELLVLAGRCRPDMKAGLDEDALFRQQAVNKAICHMEENLTKELSVEEIAGKAGLSASYLSRLFKESTGLSPWDYLLRLRLEKAKELLASSSASIAEVALRSGFCDSSHMAKTFKRLEGRSPKDCRPENPRKAGS